MKLRKIQKESEKKIEKKDYITSSVQFFKSSKSLKFKDFNFDYISEFDFKRIFFKTIKFTIALKKNSKNDNITFDIIIKTSIKSEII